MNLLRPGLKLQVFLLLLSSCNVNWNSGKIAYNYSSHRKVTYFNVTNVQLVSNQFVITGANLSEVTSLSLVEGSTTTPLVIESSTRTSLVANTLSNVVLPAGKTFTLKLASTKASENVTLNFSVCGSTFNGATINCSATPEDRDVISYDSASNQWLPRNVNGLSYRGTHSAATGIVPSASPSAGDYYIIRAAGLINSISYAIGDWISYNGDEWQKIANPRTVLSAFGRTGHVKAKEGDYTIDLLSDVDTSTTPPNTGDLLGFNASGKWVPMAPPSGSGSPTGPAGGDLLGTYPNPTLSASGVTAGTYKSVSVDVKGRVTAGTNPTTLAGYGITDTIVTSVTGVLPVAIGGTSGTPNVAMAQATTSVSGYVTSTDWNTFNDKQASLSGGATIHGIVYPASGAQTLQIPLAPAAPTHAANRAYVLSLLSAWDSLAGHVFRLSGKVGVRDTSPSFALSIGNGVDKDGGIIAQGYGTVGSSGLTLSPPGTGARFIWYPRKAALRIGAGGGAIWDDANIGLYSAAFGSGNRVSGEASMGLGSSNSVTGRDSFVNGVTTTCSANYSFVNGGSNTISGNYVTVSGCGNSTGAAANSVTVRGAVLFANNNSSTIFGGNGNALGNYAVSLGYYGLANSRAMVALGSGNKQPGSYSNNTWVLTDPLMHVGTSDPYNYTPYNAFSMLKNGNTGIGVDAPTEKLQVAGVIAPDTDGTRDVGTMALRYRDVYATNGVIQTSDERKKKDINDMDLGLDFLLKLRPVTYVWKDQSDREKHHGLIAQEVAEHVPPDSALVNYDEKSDRYGVRYEELLSPMVKAIQEMVSSSDLLEQKRETASLKEVQKAQQKEMRELEKEFKALEEEALFLQRAID